MPVSTTPELANVSIRQLRMLAHLLSVTATAHESDALALELTGATIGWKTSDLQPTGTWGDGGAGGGSVSSRWWSGWRRS